MFSLIGKTAVITGGGRGIGAGIAFALAEQGANVVLAGRTREPLEETAEMVRAKGVQAHVCVADITTFPGIDSIVKAATDAFGYIDCWVNNAGSARWQDVGRLINSGGPVGQCGRPQPEVELLLRPGGGARHDPRRLDHQHQFARRLGARAAAGQLRRRQGRARRRDGDHGCGMGSSGHPGERSGAGGHPGGARAVFLGAGASRPAARSGVGTSPIALTPLRRHGAPADVGALCAYLASDEASWISGVIIPVNGGNRIPGGLVQYMAWIDEKMDREKDQAAGG